MQNAKLRLEVKRQFITALRSGTYAQGRGKLRTPSKDNDKWCCLGVLCDLAIRDNVPVEVLRRERNVAYDMAAHIPPVAVVEWAFQTHNSNEVMATIGTLAQMNDKGATFREIAEWAAQQL
jgi:hypothetical protein